MNSTRPDRLLTHFAGAPVREGITNGCSRESGGPCDLVFDRKPPTYSSAFNVWERTSSNGGEEIPSESYEQHSLLCHASISRLHGGVEHIRHSIHIYLRYFPLVLSEPNRFSRLLALGFDGDGTDLTGIAMTSRKYRLSGAVRKRATCEAWIAAVATTRRNEDRVRLCRAFGEDAA